MRILAVCGSGLGSSFMVELNIKKVLKKWGRQAEVEHADLASATPDVADLFVMAKDIADSARIPAEKLVVLDNIIDVTQLETRLAAWFADH